MLHTQSYMYDSKGWLPLTISYVATYQRQLSPEGANQQFKAYIDNRGLKLVGGSSDSS